MVVELVERTDTFSRRSWRFPSTATWHFNSAARALLLDCQSVGWAALIAQSAQSIVVRARGKLCQTDWIGLACYYLCLIIATTPTWNRPPVVRVSKSGAFLPFCLRHKRGINAWQLVELHYINISSIVVSSEAGTECVWSTIVDV